MDRMDVKLDRFGDAEKRSPGSDAHGAQQSFADPMKKNYLPRCVAPFCSSRSPCRFASPSPPRHSRRRTRRARPGARWPPGTTPAGRGRGRGAPLTAAEQAEIATLAELPPWKPGAGDGNYSIGPDYAPCPGNDPPRRRPRRQGRDLHAQRRREQVLPAHRPARAQPHPQGNRLHPRPVQARHGRPDIVAQDAIRAPTRGSCPTSWTT